MSYIEGHCKKCDNDRGSINTESGVCQTCELFDGADRDRKVIDSLRSRLKEVEGELGKFVGCATAQKFKIAGLSHDLIVAKRACTSCKSLALEYSDGLKADLAASREREAKMREAIIRVQAHIEAGGANEELTKATVIISGLLSLPATQEPK